MKKYYINVQGGCGLNVGLSSFISWIKNEGDAKGNKEYEFYVLSPYSDVFEANENVSGVYKPEEIKDFIFDAEANDGELVMHRLYDMDGFIKKQMNYSEAWAKLMNIPWKDDKKGTKVHSVLNPIAKYPFLQQQVSDIKKAVVDNGYKNFIILQTEGGQSPLVQVPTEVRKNEKGEDVQVAAWDKVPYNYDNEPLKRHYPREEAKAFVELFQEEHPETAIILYQLPNEAGFEKCIKTVVPYLAYYELAKDADCVGTVSIDSSLQHLVAGITKSVVLWAHSKPEHFGYSFNKNIEQSCRTDDLLYFSALGPSGAKVNYIRPKELLKEVEEYLFTKEE